MNPMLMMAQMMLETQKKLKEAQEKMMKVQARQKIDADICKEHVFLLGTPALWFDRGSISVCPEMPTRLERPQDLNK